MEDMNLNRTLKSLMFSAAALLLLAACTQDEPGGQGNELPYGEYPLQISGVTLDVESSTVRAAYGNGMGRKRYVCSWAMKPQTIR